MYPSIIDEYAKEFKRIENSLNSEDCTEERRKELEKRKDRLLESASNYVVNVDKNIKPKPTKGETILEWAKVIIPVVVPIFAYDIFQKRVLKFEEDGSICSSAGRQLHLPRFFK